MSIPLWVAIEGPDGAGKSSIAAKLAGKIKARGVDVQLVATPTHHESGQIARQVSALGAEGVSNPCWRQLYFLADTLHAYASIIDPALRHGAVVISDRWLSSTLVYYSATMHYLGMRDKIRDGDQALNDFARTVTRKRPDVEFLVETPIALRMQRLAQKQRTDWFEERDEKFQENVARIYRQRAREHGWLTLLGDGDAGAEADRALRHLDMRRPDWESVGGWEHSERRGHNAT